MIAYLVKKFPTFYGTVGLLPWTQGQDTGP